MERSLWFGDENMDEPVITDLEHFRSHLGAPAGGGAQIGVDAHVHIPMLPLRLDQACWRSNADSTALSDAVVMFGSVPIPQRVSDPAALST